MRPRSVLAGLLLSLVASAPLWAADATVRRGIDVFRTPADGSTFYDFAKNPIPAGFFCKRSQAFAGRVAFKGLPLATGAAGQLWNGDTVVERLDDATFDATGVARTRLQFRALSLVSVAPLKTACGDFHVYVSLGGKQRVTAMAIHRTKESGGDFVAPLAVNARMTFVPVRAARTKGAPKLELAGAFTFPAHPLPWSFASQGSAGNAGAAFVDTDGDLRPDTAFAGVSNFTPGQAPKNLKAIGGQISCCRVCHAQEEGKLHCYIPANCNKHCDE